MKVQSTLLAFSGLVTLSGALPAVRRDSSTNEPAVEAPNGTPITLSDYPTATSYDDSSSNSYSNSNSNSNSYGDSNDSSNNYGSNSYDTSSMYDSSYSTSVDDSMSTMVYNTWTSTMTDDATSTYAYMTTTAYDNTYTAAATSTYMTEDSMSTDAATSTWMSSSSTATYGSGYTPSSYDNCVQQCMASYAPPPSMVTATPSYNNDDSSSSGSGATHTVIVAPTQGVLRYVPFAVNASVGDTVRFVWGAGPHTVTKSSEFNLCNATSDNPFKSGPQNKSFVFDQVVNDTNPVFYYCGIPTHCEKGMFGIINPPNAEPAATSSAQNMIDVMAANNSDVAAQWSYTMMNTMNSTAASMWGSNMDLSQITSDPEGQLALIQNVMFTRLAMAQNPQYVGTDGSFNPNIAQGMSVPMDPAQLSSNATVTSNSGSDPSSSTGSGSETSAPAATTSTSGASRRVASSATAVFAAVAIAALVL